VNKHLVAILLFCCLGRLHAQDTALQSIGGLLDSYFLAAETMDSTMRFEAFQLLFTESGTINSVVMNSDGSNRVKQGNWKSYIEKSGSYYNRFTPHFVEDSREMEFYLEIASVHCIVSQYSAQKTSGKKFKERYWMQFDLVYLANRWYIDNVLWVNEIQGIPIENALLTDTLLYSPD
jgi:hypothetical protein